MLARGGIVSDNIETIESVLKSIEPVADMDGYYDRAHEFHFKPNPFAFSYDGQICPCESCQMAGIWWRFFLTVIPLRG